ncbi:hypothetical protein ACFS5L_05875 [Streptomyces phyllanthi]|uniref:Uncharacterized protein n=1 Tax=Streptomyces phyllanthi TaxID=1803180 RepID=A0A5N8VYE7_9ACTN|nr:hypothetical protein [Streptomyces phyllanthi]MPY39124.1 hypothetical protein [Streptomyces phyllanthi]
MVPDTTRQELAAIRGSFDASVAAVTAAGASAVWAIWAWWALPLALLLAVAFYRLFALPRAEMFAGLLEAAFDVHRCLLYKALRWPVPTDPESEPLRGQELTAYLWRGTAPLSLQFEAEVTQAQADDE